VAGAADIPATRLFGKAPDGMNATGEGDLANYFQSIGAKQDMQLRPALQQIDAVMLPSAGVKADLPWAFSTLMVLTEQQQAEIEAKEADTITKIAAVALMPESALAKTVQNRLIESGRWPGLKKLIEEAEKAGEGLPEGEETELGIVPVGSEGGDRTSAGAGGGTPVNSSARRAANDAAVFFGDAAPRPLYVQRKLLNASALIAWAKENGFTSTLAPDDVHVTVLYSRLPVDPMKMGESWSGDDQGRIRVKPGGPRAIERFGENAVVLLFASWELESRHRSMVEAGGSHDFDNYHPHVTLSYEVPADIDLAAIKPYAGALEFGPELFEPLDLDWKRKVVEE
jgi:hypothetical protein